MLCHLREAFAYGWLSICIFLLSYVFELVRRKHLTEEYSLGWLVTGALMLILSIFEDLFEDMLTDFEKNSQQIMNIV